MSGIGASQRSEDRWRPVACPHVRRFPEPRPRRGLAAVALVTAVPGAQYWLYTDRSEHWIDLALPRGSLRVLVANDASDHSRGLSRRDDMPGDGLLLEWDAPGRHPIWMIDVRFPLDLIWLERDGRVASVLTNVPACASPTCPLYEPNGNTNRSRCSNSQQGLPRTTASR